MIELRDCVTNLLEHAFHADRGTSDAMGSFDAAVEVLTEHFEHKEIIRAMADEDLYGVAVALEEVLSEIKEELLDEKIRLDSLAMHFCRTDNVFKKELAERHLQVEEWQAQRFEDNARYEGSKL